MWPRENERARVSVRCAGIWRFLLELLHAQQSTGLHWMRGGVLDLRDCDRGQRYCSSACRAQGEKTHRNAAYPFRTHCNSLDGTRRRSLRQGEDGDRPSPPASRRGKVGHLRWPPLATCIALCLKQAPDAWVAIELSAYEESDPALVEMIRQSGRAQAGVGCTKPGIENYRGRGFT